MGENPVKLGSMTLLLTIVLLCMAILSVLTLSTAHADLALSQKYADRLHQVYALDSKGQQLLAQVDLALQNGATADQVLALMPEETQFNDNVATVSLEAEGQVLTIMLQLNENHAEILQWKPGVKWSVDEKLEGLWGAD